MEVRTWEDVAKGTKVRLKNGRKEWEYRGMEKGKILLFDRPLGTTLVVKKEDVDWNSSTPQNR